MDGGFHFENNTISGQTKEESQEIDNYKDELADKHGIKVIRINCEQSELEYIKNNILKSELNELFDLSMIDWNKCEEFALSNLVKIACEYKKNNPNMTTTDISKIINLSQITISRYLKKGTKLNWCDYNPKEEKIKSNKNAGNRAKKSCSKPVEIYKNGIKLNYLPFKSVAELARQSEKLFGVKLDFRNISAVCTGVRTAYKGFTFKYI